MCKPSQLAQSIVFQSLSLVQLFVSPWIAACQFSLSFTISWILLKLMSIESVMLSNHLNLCRSLLLLTSIFPRIKVFSKEAVLRIRYAKVQGFSCGSAGKEFACNVEDLGLISGLGRSPGEGKGYPLQYSGIEKSMDCIVHGVAKSWIRLSDFHIHTYIGMNYTEL